MCKDRTGYVRGVRTQVKQCRIDGQDPSECTPTPRIFPDPVPFRNGYGCVGLQDKGSISVVHVICGLHCIVCHQKRGGGKKLEEWRRAMEDRGLNINIDQPEVQWRWKLGWKLRYQSTGR